VLGLADPLELRLELRLGVIRKTPHDDTEVLRSANPRLDSSSMEHAQRSSGACNLFRTSWQTVCCRQCKHLHGNMSCMAQPDITWILCSPMRAVRRICAHGQCGQVRGNIALP